MVSKVVILAGGLGSRLSEETSTKPKPMVRIGDMPILWHIMRIYSHYGLNEFIICLGYKGYIIKEFFSNYHLHTSNVQFNLENNESQVLHSHAEPWRVTLINTGDTTNTGGRLKRVAEYLGDEDFCFTYGDGVGDVDIASLLKFHQEKNCLATVTAVRPPARFGKITIEDDIATTFEEKPVTEGGWINGGFFVLSPKVIPYIKDDDSSWEKDALIEIVRQKQLAVFKHGGFWQPMDTLREKKILEDHWEANTAPWKIWK